MLSRTLSPSARKGKPTPIVAGTAARIPLEAAYAAIVLVRVKCPGADLRKSAAKRRCVCAGGAVAERLDEREDLGAGGGPVRPYPVPISALRMAQKLSAAA